MKNLTTLVYKSDVHEYCESLFRSEAFIDSYDTKGFVWDQVERFAWLPRFFADTTNDQLERAHFCTWWNVIMRRDYDNDIIHDLYYLHEMTHAATMPYFGLVGKAAFDEKMQRNELEASVLSEIAVYFELPGLREESFGHEIYADRFLNDPAIQALWRMNKEVALETLRTMRRHVMVSKPEHQMDTAEVWIRRFAEQNAAYAITWADRYKEIEEHMAKFQLLAASDRRAAADNHWYWLQELMLQDRQDAIPFREEAELFSPFYWSNKAKYEAAMKG